MVIQQTSLEGARLVEDEVSVKDACDLSQGGKILQGAKGSPVGGMSSMPPGAACVMRLRS